MNDSVSYTHLRAHETVLDLVCRLLLEKKKVLSLLLRSQTTPCCCLIISISLLFSSLQHIRQYLSAFR
ncbi:hypothetical protein PVA38_10590 [Streptococcus pneumoniae D39]|nr:hypothetical protein PVA38_10590 [Streptococcus pneumoniae D39]